MGSRGFMLMRELVRVGHTCTIITSDSNTLVSAPILTSSHLVQNLDGITFCWVRTLKYATAKSMRRILSWLDFELKLLFLPLSRFTPPNVVIVSSLSLLTIFNGLWLRRRFGCRLVFEVRDIWPLTLTEEGGFSPWNPFIKALGWVEWLGYRHADIIVGTMPNLGEHVREVLGHTRKVHCIPMGIDPAAINDIEPLPKDYVQSYIPNNKFIVAYIGSIGITNALDTFFECAAQMAAFPHIHFLLVGSGDLGNSYRTRYGHLENLTFAPSVPHIMVQSVLKYCDLLYFSVHPSKVWQYGQSLNKVVDYMLSGKPILASYTGYPSMISEAKCGDFVPVMDQKSLIKKIEHFAALPDFERAAIGNRGREWLLKHRNYKDLANSFYNIMFQKV